MDKAPLKRKAEEISTLSEQEILKKSHELLDLLKKSPSSRHSSKKQKGEFLEKVRLLLLEGANPNIFDKYNERTSLIHAARFGDADLMQLLLEHKGNPNLVDDKNVSLLLWAVIEKNYGVVQLLAAYNVNPNIQDNKGFSPLMHAAATGDVRMVRLLLEEFGTEQKPELKTLQKPSSYLSLIPADLLGLVTQYFNPINVNLVNKEGDSALILATKTSSPTIVQLLLENDANREIKNKEGKTALDIAQRNNYKKIVTLLQNPHAE